MVGGSCSLYVYTLLSKKSFTKIRFSSTFRRDLFNNAAKIQETHERHSIIDLEFRLVVRQVIQTLKDEYFEHQDNVKRRSTILRTTRMTNITLDYATVIFPT